MGEGKKVSGKMAPNLKSAVQKVSKALKADVFLWAGPLLWPSDAEFVNQCHVSSTKNPNALLLLTTYGGEAHAAYKIARCLHRRYKKLYVYVDTDCESGGTLLALGADELIIAPNGQLGPIDVQVRKVEEVGEMASGLTPVVALESLRDQAAQSLAAEFKRLRFGGDGFRLTTRMAADVATKMVVGLYKPIYEQIDPMRLGELDRFMRIALEYGKRIARNLKQDTLVKLVVQYPAHDFVIDAEEARQLFHIVKDPTKEQIELADLLRAEAREGLSAKRPTIRYLTDEVINANSRREIHGQRPAARRKKVAARAKSAATGDGAIGKTGTGKVAQLPSRSAGGAKTG